MQLTLNEWLARNSFLSKVKPFLEGSKIVIPYPALRSQDCQLEPKRYGLHGALTLFLGAAMV